MGLPNPGMRNLLVNCLDVAYIIVDCRSVAIIMHHVVHDFVFLFESVDLAERTKVHALVPIRHAAIVLTGVSDASVRTTKDKDGG
jgi:hypothetical protein